MARSLGITEKELYANSSKKIIQDIVRGQSEVIDVAIFTAHNAGFSKIKHELPTTFNINCMSKKDAQIMIYSELLMLYKTERDFKNVFLDNGPTPSLHISWVNGMNEDDRIRRQQLINSCLLPIENTNRRNNRG